MYPPRTAIASLALLALLALPARLPAAAETRLDAGLSAGLAVSDSADYAAAAHAGLGLAFGAEFLGRRLLPLRLALSYERIRPSAYDASLSRYRGFEAWSLSTLAGARLFPSASAPALELDLLAGAGLSAARYLDTPLVFAFPSLRAEARLHPFPSPAGEGWTFALPLALMFRGDTSTWSAGIAVGYALAPKPKAGE